MIDLRLGDCLEVLPTLAGVDAVVTDPPYGIALKSHDKTGISRRKADYRIDGDASQEVGIKALELCSAWPVAAFASPMKPWPGKWRQHLVWDKKAGGGGGDIATCWKFDWELIQVARTGPLNGGRDSSILRYFADPQQFNFHPAAKPVDLMVYLISKVTQPGDTVLDPFMGSGTTGVACMQLGRNFIGIEKDPAYFAIAQNRIAEAQAQLVLAL